MRILPNLYLTACTNRFTFFLILLTLSVYVHPNRPTVPDRFTLSERERALVVDELLEDRFTTLLPQLMRREGLKSEYYYGEKVLLVNLRIVNHPESAQQ